MTSPPPNAASRTLALWLPDWPVQRLRRQRAELRRQAVVMVEGHARSERVAACSPEARRLGVTVGMRAPDAQSLAGPARLRLLPHRPGEDRRALEQLAAHCERFSPVVALEDVEQPAALLLDVSGLAPLWGQADGERRLAEAVLHGIDSEGWVGRVAVAPTIGLALGLARYTPWSNEPLLAPDASLAAALPVEALRVDPATTTTLRDLGVDVVGRLMALPRATLPARFGQELGQRLDAMLGAAPEPVESFRAEPPLVAQWPFETPVANGEALEHTVRTLLDKLATRMRRRRLGALRVLILYVYDSSLQPERIALRLFRPTSSARELAELATLHTSGLRMRGAVASVRVEIGATAPIASRQQTLFDNDPRDDPHELALLVNRLASRLGAERVARVQPRRSHDPHRAYALEPATDAVAGPYSLTPSQGVRLRRMPLAMPLDTEPLRVETDAGGAPIAAGRQPVVRCWGPERVETGWWRGRGVRRDAYWVELADGSRLWLTRDLRTSVWRQAGQML